MKMTIKHNFYPFCSSRENALQRFLMPCVIDPLKALLHWDVTVLMDRWALMMWFSPAVVKRWPAFICTRGSNTTANIELYVHLHQRRTDPHTISPEAVMSVSFHQSLLDAWGNLMCVWSVHMAWVCRCVCLDAYVLTWLKKFSSDFSCLSFQQFYSSSDQIHSLLNVRVYVKTPHSPAVWLSDRQ